jgi:hypothetical protein
MQMEAGSKSKIPVTVSQRVIGFIETCVGFLTGVLGS